MKASLKGKPNPFSKLQKLKGKLRLIGKLNKTMQEGHKEKPFRKKQHEELVQKISFSGEEYEYNFSLSPGVAFYKFLAKRSSKPGTSKLQVSIPDTLVLNDGNARVWIYTAEDGNVYRSETFSDRQVLESFGASANINEVACVVKRPRWNPKLSKVHGLNTFVLNSFDLKTRLNEFSQGDVCSIQKFIRSKGPVPFVCRVVYRRNSRSCLYVVTNKTSFTNENAEPKDRCLTNIHEEESCNIITTHSGRYLEDTLPILKRLAKFLETHLKVEVLELAGDFIKDENDRWWFVTCKAFRFKSYDLPRIEEFMGDKPYWSSDEESSKAKSPLPEYQRLKRCRLCQVYHPVSGLPHQLTIKMIIETDQHLRERGVMIKWLDRAEYRHSGSATLYQSYPVCRECYNLYELTEQLKEAQAALSKAFSFPEKQQQIDQDEVIQEKLQTVGKSASLVLNEQPKAVLEDQEIRKPMKLIRILILLQEFKELQKFHTEANYSFSFSMFDIQETYPLKKPSENSVKIQKIKMYQVFSSSRAEFIDYLNKFPTLRVNLHKGNKIICYADLELIDFRNPIVKYKDYFKMFSHSKGLVGYLNCKVLVEEEHDPIDVTNINLHPYNGLFLPPEDLVVCVPLPDEWMEILPKFERKPVSLRTSVSSFKKRLNNSACEPTHYKSRSTQKSPLPPKPIPSKKRRLSQNLDTSFNHKNPPKIFRVEYQVFSVTGLNDQDKTQWTLFCELFGKGFGYSESSRTCNSINFNASQHLFVKAQQKSFPKFLKANQLNIRIAKGSEEAQLSVNMLSHRQISKGCYELKMANRKGVYIDLMAEFSTCKFFKFEVEKDFGTASLIRPLS